MKPKIGAASREADLVRRGIGFHNARAFLEAERCYQSVLRENPKNTDALNLMGVLAIEANRTDLALDYFSKAVKLAPGIAMYRNNLGNALSVSSDLEEALVHLNEAAKIDPGYVDALCNLGKVHRLLGNINEAGGWFDKALAVAPGNLRARAGKAEIASELGHFSEAIATFEEILRQDPINVDAFCGLALARKFEAGDPLIGRFESLLANKSLRADQLAPLFHSFAKICNDVGRFDEAFNHFTTGKRYKNARFDADRLEQNYRVLTDLFVQSFFTERQTWGSQDERPVFVVGLPRSGTSLTEQVLASHSQVAGLGELPDMRKVAQSIGYGTLSPHDFSLKVRGLGRSEVAKLAERYLRAYGHSPKPGAKRLVDKSPHNYELLGLIALLFPKAHILFCRRDPLDNCVAIYMQNFNDSHGYNRSLADLGRYWRAYKLFSDRMIEQVPLKTSVVDYENTVANFESSARAMVDFLGLPWDDSCLNYHETERQVRTPSRWQVRQPIYNTSVERWRRYEKHLGPLKEALGLTQSENR